MLNLISRKKELDELKESHLHELEKISGLTTEQAKEYLLKSVEEDVKHETAVLVKELNKKAKEEADKKQGIMLSQLYRDVRQIMLQRQLYQLCSFQMMK